MNYLSRAIQYLRPGAQFSYTEDNYSTIQWYALEGDAPTQKEIDAAIEQIKADEITEATTKATQKAALLDRLGITEDEARLLLG
jgi:hypothetical protein